MARGTLSLKKPVAFEVDSATPVPEQLERPARHFDADKPWAYYSGLSGVAFVQGDSFFDASHGFVSIAPEPAWYFPTLLPGEERAARKRKAINLAQLVKNVPSVPAALLEAEQENIRALAAEQHAA